MRSFHLICSILFVAVLGLLSCKNDRAAEQQEATSEPQAQQVAPDSASSHENATSSEASTGGHDYTFLTDKILLYKAAFGGDKAGEQPYKDEWIDLQPDGTFKAGKHKKQTHTGQWSYDHEKRTLFLRPDVKEYKMSEWQVMFNDQMIVWVGTSTYGDNNVQIKLVRSEVLPD